MPQEYQSFDEKIIQQSIAAAQAQSQRIQASATEGHAQSNGELKVGGQCISVTVADHKVCLNLPLGFGSYCFTVPDWVPNGAEVKACIDICTKWGIPCGIEVSLSLNGTKILSQGFGCSC
jgi:hypothetical protein